MTRRIFALLFPAAAAAQTGQTIRRGSVKKGDIFNEPVISNTVEHGHAVWGPLCPHEWIASGVFSLRANLLGNTGSLFVPVEHCARCGQLRLPVEYRGQR